MEMLYRLSYVGRRRQYVRAGQKANRLAFNKLCDQIADDVQRAFVDELVKLQRCGGRVNGKLQFWCPAAHVFHKLLQDNYLERETGFEPATLSLEG